MAVLVMLPASDMLPAQRQAQCDHTLCVSLALALKPFGARKSLLASVLYSIPSFYFTFFFFPVEVHLLLITSLHIHAVF